MYLTSAKPLSPFIFSKIVFIEPNHDGTFASWSSFDSVYAPDNKGKEDWIYYVTAHYDVIYYILVYHDRRKFHFKEIVDSYKVINE